MEATGLGVGVVALAGLFNNAVDSYGYGEALGLNATVAKTTQLPIALGSAGEVAEAEKALGNIVHLLDDAQLLSQRYKNRESLDETSTLDPNESYLHQKARYIVTQRQRNTSFAKKAAWPLYRKNDLENLVEDIANLTNQLVNLFLATRPRQQELSAAELAELGDENLPFVKCIADAQDPLLATAAQEAMQARGSTYYQPITRNGAAAHYGHLIHHDYQGPVGGLSHTYHGPLAEGKGTKQHCGNVYGGTSLT
ncbi:hypothetical protein KCU61_g4967, partial [Aureobasidium melanogenum]